MKDPELDPSELELRALFDKTRHEPSRAALERMADRAETAPNRVITGRFVRLAAVILAAAAAIALGVAYSDSEGAPDREAIVIPPTSAFTPGALPTAPPTAQPTAPQRDERVADGGANDDVRAYEAGEMFAAFGGDALFAYADAFDGGGLDTIGSSPEPLDPLEDFELLAEPSAANATYLATIYAQLLDDV
ncbi:MAG: hypothetical protein EXR75_09305 [Myxococcales bacterium]|nr:hypothetical protein [Myxococcales bacterium]